MRWGWYAASQQPAAVSSRTSYCAYENGKTEIGLENLIRLAEIYHTSVDYLLGLTDEPRPYPRKKKK